MWFVLGLIAGSVANAMVDRLPRRESWFAGRSHCDKCGHVLGVADLVPVVSYLSLGGKCRYCRSPIGRRNLVVELFLGLSFIVINGHSWSYNSLILSAILWVTVMIAVMDWETQLVSDWLVGMWFVLIIFNVQYSIFNIYGLLVGAGVIGGLWLVTKKEGWEGDIKDCGGNGVLARVAENCSSFVDCVCSWSGLWSLAISLWQDDDEEQDSFWAVVDVGGVGGILLGTISN